jgi:hypothetical protein
VLTNGFIEDVLTDSTTTSESDPDKQANDPNNQSTAQQSGSGDTNTNP